MTTPPAKSVCRNCGVGVYREPFPQPGDSATRWVHSDGRELCHPHEVGNYMLAEPTPRGGADGSTEPLRRD